MKRILLPTDFSENSRNAIEYALHLFAGNPCEFVLLNVQKPADFVMDDFYTASNNASINEAVIQDNKKQLEALSNELKKSHSNEDFKFQTVVDFDMLPDAIIQLSNKENIDMVVMGTNGATGAIEAIFGSNTLRVIRNVDAPILAIPAGYKFEPVEGVLFSISAGDTLEGAEFKSFEDLLELTRASLDLLTIHDKNATDSEKLAYRKMLAPVFDKHSYNLHQLTGIPAPMAVDTFTQLHEPQLHCILVQKESFLKRFVFGSHSTTIEYRTRIPLLVLHH